MDVVRRALAPWLRVARAAVPRWALACAIPFVVWGLYTFARGERRWEVVALALAMPALATHGDGSRRALAGLYPVALTGLFYDAMRFVQYAGIRPADVHLCDLRDLEARLFGITYGGQRATVHDWLQAHPSRLLDVVCAVPYGTFLFAAVAFGLYLYRRDTAALQRYAWTFLALNLLGFATYHLYPAAPPWYFHARGCAVDLAARASEGPNLARVDALLGVGYFHGFYGRSHDVFGAVPSLHVSYPLLFALVGWPYFGPALRVASVTFFVTMCFAAVYLDHHWIIDVVLGVAYTLATYTAVRFVHARAARPSL